MVCQQLQAQGAVSNDIRQSLAVFGKWGKPSYNSSDTAAATLDAAVMVSIAPCKCCSTISHCINGTLKHCKSDTALLAACICQHEYTALAQVSHLCIDTIVDEAALLLPLDVV